MTNPVHDMRRASKFLSLVLRHAPEKAGIVLDPGGWADASELLTGAASAGVVLTRDQLDELVATNAKQRFAFDATGSRLRAVQGHSIAIDLGYEPAEPPAVLFHGTAARSVPNILHEGLKPMSRQHVHLSPDQDTARAVGSRNGSPVILTVDAAAMRAHNVPFWRAPNGVWLCPAVAPDYLTPPVR